MKYKESQADKNKWHELKAKETERMLKECKEVENNLDKALKLSKQKEEDLKKYKLLPRYI